MFHVFQPLPRGRYAPIRIQAVIGPFRLFTYGPSSVVSDMRPCGHLSPNVSQAIIGPFSGFGHEAMQPCFTSFSRQPSFSLSPAKRSSDYLNYRSAPFFSDFRHEVMRPLSMCFQPSGHRTIPDIVILRPFFSGVGHTTTFHVYQPLPCCQYSHS